MYFSWFEKGCCAGEVVAFIFVEVAFVDSVEALNVGVAFVFEDGSVEGWDAAGDGEAVFGGVAEVFCHVGGVPHYLLRHASNVDLEVRQTVNVIVSKIESETNNQKDKRRDWGNGKMSCEKREDGKD